MSTLTQSEICELISDHENSIGYVANGYDFARAIEQLAFAKASERIADLENRLEGSQARIADLELRLENAREELRTKLYFQQSEPVSETPSPYIEDNYENNPYGIAVTKLIAHDLDGAIYDAEKGDGFDATCLETMRRVSAKLHSMDQPTIVAPPHSEQQEPFGWLVRGTILKEQWRVYLASEASDVDAVNYMRNYRYKGEIVHEIKEIYDAPQPSQEQVRDAMRDALAEQLNDLYYCGRVWEAWQVGTMRQDDFSIASEDDDIVENFVNAAMGVLQSQPKQSTGSEG